MLLSPVRESAAQMIIESRLEVDSEDMTNRIGITKAI